MKYGRRIVVVLCFFSSLSVCATAAEGGKGFSTYLRNKLAPSGVGVPAQGIAVPAVGAPSKVGVPAVGVQAQAVGVPVVGVQAQAVGVPAQGVAVPAVGAPSKVGVPAVGVQAQAVGAPSKIGQKASIVAQFLSKTQGRQVCVSYKSSSSAVSVPAVGVPPRRTDILARFIGVSTQQRRMIE